MTLQDYQLSRSGWDAGVVRPKGGFDIFEHAAVFIALLVFSTGSFAFLFESGSEDGPAALLLQLAVYALASVCIFRWWKTVAEISASSWILYAPVVLALLSTAWSAVPGTTARRSLILVATTCFGVYFGARFSPRRQILLLAAALGAVAVASLLVAVLLPSYGISDVAMRDGDWKGIFDTKNELAKQMTLAAVVFTFLPRRLRYVRWLGILLSAGLVVASGSRAGWVICFLLVTCSLALQGIQRKSLMVPTTLLFGLAGLCLVYWAGVNMDAISAAFDRDATLTGRDDLWTVVISLISRSPLVGYGFNAVWSSNSSIEAYIHRQVGWEPPHAHNGLLDLGLDLGLLGILVFLVGFVAFSIQAARNLKRERTSEECWPILYLLFLFSYNLTESSLLKASSMYWFLYAAVVGSLAAFAPLRQRHSPAVIPEGVAGTAGFEAWGADLDA